MSRRIREQGRLVSNQSILSEVLSRDREVSRIRQENQQGTKPGVEQRNPCTAKGLSESKGLTEPGSDKDKEASQESSELTAEQLLLHYASASSSPAPSSSSPPAPSSEQTSLASDDDDDEGVIPYDQIPDVEVYPIDELRGGRIGRW